MNSSDNVVFPCVMRMVWGEWGQN